MPNCSSSGSTSCYGSWQQQHGEPALYCEFGASFSEGTTSEENNTSVVNYSYYVNYTSDSALFYGTTRSEAGTTRVYVDGNLVSSVYVPIEYNYSDGHRDLVSGRGSCTVKHNEDGTKKINCRIDLAGGTDPRGAGFAWDSAYGSNGSMTLTTINRGGKVAVSPNTITIDGENELTITVTDTKSRAHTLDIKVGNYSTKVTLPAGTTTYKWKPTKELIPQIGTGNGGSASVTLTTQITSTVKKTDTATFGVSVSNSTSATISKEQNTITFSFNGQFFKFDNLFEGRVPRVTKLAVAMYQNGSVPLMPFVEVDRITFTKDTWNQMIKGDTIKIDTEEATIFKNSSVEHRLGALGNDYERFVLVPGVNQIQCLNSDWVETPPDFKLKYREVYL